MANNRIYLKCEACGKTLFLGKRGQVGYHYESYDGVPPEDKLNRFYQEHTFCGGELGYDENPDSSIDNYRVEYEFDDTGKCGHYIVNDGGDSSCSVCGDTFLDCTQNYCPNCGARMSEPGYEVNEHGVCLRMRQLLPPRKRLYERQNEFFVADVFLPDSR